MTNFKMSLRLSAVFVLALAFCCLVIGQAAVANGSGISKKFTTNNRLLEQTPPAAIEKLPPTTSNRITVPQKPASSGRPNIERGDKQGGDVISSATVITTLPYSDAGTTTGYTHDYNEACTYTTAGAPDVVYAYTPSANVVVNLSLCGSGYDTKMYVYNSDPPTVGSPVACNDDSPVCGSGSAGYRSYIGALSLSAGTTYYIIVDGYGSSSNGTYTLNVTVAACDVTQPVGAALEGEACSGDLDNPPADNVNGGCNSTPNVFGSIALGGSVFGQTWSNATTGYRDTDWYQFTLTEPMTVTLKGVSEAPVALYLLSGTCAGGMSVAASANLLVPCDTGVASTILLAGTYVAWVGGTGTTDNLCANGPWNYYIKLTGVPATVVAGDFCADPIVITDGSYDGTNVGATVDGPYAHGNNVWYRYTATCDGTATASMCASPNNYLDLRMYVYAGGACPTVTYIANNDDGCVTPDYGTPTVSFPVTAGSQYMIEIGNYTGELGAFNLALSCEAGGGLSNDNCADAIPVTNGVYTGTNVGATVDGPFAGYGPDVWYCYTATCDGLATASMCAGTPTTFDAMLAVFDGCACPASGADLIGNGDDDCGYSYGPSAYTWPVVAGQQYMIMILGYSTADVSDFTLTMSCLAIQPPPENDDCDYWTVSNTPVLGDGDSYLFHSDDVFWATNDCDSLSPTNEVWIAFTTTEACSRAVVSYCPMHTEGLGWSIFTILFDACPCGGYYDNEETTSTQLFYSCPADGFPGPNARMTYDSLPPGTYYYPILVDPSDGWDSYDYDISVSVIACPPYCAAGATCDEYIDRVQVGTIDNASGVCSAGGYKDYTKTFSTSMYKGVSYPITVTGMVYPGDDYVLAWVDYNLDFVFDNVAGSNEIITFVEGANTGASFEPVDFTGVITPPATAITGETTLRVRLKYYTLPVPCGILSYGETEDYKLDLQPLPCGDVNMDGNFDIADIDYLIAYYFTAGPAPLPIPANGDTNGDCCINIADIVYLADYIFRAGADPICLPCNP
jgi:hypothetical protein